LVATLLVSVGRLPLSRHEGLGILITMSRVAPNRGRASCVEACGVAQLSYGGDCDGELDTAQCLEGAHEREEFPGRDAISELWLKMREAFLVF